MNNPIQAQAGPVVFRGGRGGCTPGAVPPVG